MSSELDQDYVPHEVVECFTGINNQTECPPDHVVVSMTTSHQKRTPSSCSLDGFGAQGRCHSKHPVWTIAVLLMETVTCAITWLCDVDV